jgi:hypothetical protein
MAGVYDLDAPRGPELSPVSNILTAAEECVADERALQLGIESGTMRRCIH